MHCSKRFELLQVYRHDKGNLFKKKKMRQRENIRTLWLLGPLFIHHFARLLADDTPDLDARAQIFFYFFSASCARLVLKIPSRGIWRKHRLPRPCLAQSFLVKRISRLAHFRCPEMKGLVSNKSNSVLISLFYQPIKFCLL